MTEQTRNVTEAVIAKNLDDKLAQIKRDKANDFIKKINKHLKILRTLHHYGSTPDEVKVNREDEYFSSWFQESEAGDVQAMHSILDHFEPLQIITNMGHNYRTKFSMTETKVILDFRPGNRIPEYDYVLNDVDLEKHALSNEKYKSHVRSYLYSSILRMAKELTLYFPLKTLSFHINCKALDMEGSTITISASQIEHFSQIDFGDEFNSEFEKVVDIK
jgi:hypothetical protein